MRTIIFEGIATSGKTSIEKHLMDILDSRNISYLFVSEDKTLLPLLHNSDEQKAIDLLRESVRSAYKERKDIYIFDRLHLTHALRTRAGMEQFREIEELLMPHNPILILLKVAEEKIPERVLWAIAHRGSSWVSHVRSYGNDQQIFQHYINQQRELEMTIDASILPHHTIETSSMYFKEIAESIYATYLEH